MTPRLKRRMLTRYLKTKKTPQNHSRYLKTSPSDLSQSLESLGLFSAIQVQGVQVKHYLQMQGRTMMLMTLKEGVHLLSFIGSGATPEVVESEEGHPCPLAWV